MSSNLLQLQPLKESKMNQYDLEMMKKLEGCNRHNHKMEQEVKTEKIFTEDLCKYVLYLKQLLKTNDIKFTKMERTDVE